MRLPRALAPAWAAFLVAALALEPAASADARTPLWADATLATFWAALLGAGLLALLGRRRAALAASAGAVGVGLGYACGATEHHLGGWWLAETGASGALALLSGAALLGRRGQDTWPAG